MITANIYSETGGIDASIGFETTRNENVGVAFNDALNFFSYFVNDKVSSKTDTPVDYDLDLVLTVQ